MNRIYRLVWNKTRGALVAVSELASHHQGVCTIGVSPAVRLISIAALGIGGFVHGSHAHAQSINDVKLDDLQALVTKYDSTSAPAARTTQLAQLKATVDVGALPVANGTVAAIRKGVTAMPAKAVAVAKSAVSSATSSPLSSAALPVVGGNNPINPSRYTVGSAVPDTHVPVAANTQINVGAPGVPVAGDRQRAMPAAPTGALPAVLGGIVGNESVPALIGVEVNVGAPNQPVTVGNRQRALPVTSAPALPSVLGGIVGNEGLPGTANTGVQTAPLPGVAGALNSVVTGVVNDLHAAPAVIHPVSAPGLSVGNGGLVGTTLNVVGGTPAEVLPAIAQPAQQPSGTKPAMVQAPTTSTSSTKNAPTTSASPMAPASASNAPAQAVDTTDTTADTPAAQAPAADASTTSPQAAPASSSSTMTSAPASSSGPMFAAAPMMAASPMVATPQAAPVVPPPSATPTGLIVGNGGAVGTTNQLLGTGENSIFNNTNGYVTNGGLKVNDANFEQGYSTVNLLGLPVVNATPTGTVLTTTGGTVLGATGANSHLTLIGAVTSDSYITNVNNGANGGLLGVVLPTSAPAWASTCLNVLGVVNESCWAVNAAQDYQVLMGDGATANGSKEVVIGTNATHTLPQVSAATAFPGAGPNDPNNPTGVPNANYAARLGHSVVIGDNASGTANAQTILGAEASASAANSVALGYQSTANRGAQAGYTAFGLTTPQNSAGEVSIGSSGQERQITNVAAGSAPTDAVNVAQLQGVAVVAGNSVQYDDATQAKVTLAGPASIDGGVTGGTTVTNVHQGALTATSTDAVNGAQLFATNQQVAQNTTNITNLGNQVNSIYDTGTKYFHANSTQAASNAAGTGSVAVGPVANAYGSSSIAQGLDAVAGVNGNAAIVNDIALGNGAQATGGNAIAQGTGAIANAAGAVAIGQTATATGGQAVSIGVGNTASGNGAVAIGDPDVATGLGAVAMGANNTATGQGAVALGNQNTATGQGSVAVGNTSNATAAGAVALGDTAVAGNAGAVALGSGSTTAAAVATTGTTIAGTAYTFAGTTPGSTVSVGSAANQRTITNVAAGQLSATSTDAVNGSELFATNQALNSLSTVAGNAVQYDNPGKTSVTLGGVGSATPVVLTNLASGVNPTDAVNVSQLTTATNKWVAANPTTYVAPVATGANSTAIGSGAVANGAGDVALGNGTVSTGPDATTNYTTANAVVNGQTFTVNQAPTNGALAVGNRQITQVADGEVSANSTDAVNGSQLYNVGHTLSTQVTNLGNSVTSSLGGNSTYNAATGTVTTSLSYAGNTYNSVQGVLNQINGSVNGGGIKYFHANSTLADSAATGSDSVAIGPASIASTANAVSIGNGAAAAANAGDVALGAGSDTAAVVKTTGITLAGTTYAFAGTAPTSTVSVGSVGAERTITNVAAGQITATSTDAINGSELYATDMAVNNLSQQISSLGGGNSVQYDSSSKSSVTLGGQASTDGGVTGGTKISNVHQGALTATSTDAVNGSQVWQWTQDTSNIYSNTSLYNAIQNISSTNTGGGGSKYLSVSSTMGGANATGSNSVAVGPMAQASGSDTVAVGMGATASAPNAVALGAGSVADRAGTVSVGSAGNERQIANVADGTAATDAVNVRQLANGMQQTANWANAYTDQRIGQLSGQIQQMGASAYAGVASSMAMAGLPQAYEPGKSMAAVGGGTYRGESSVAVGVSTISEGGRWVFKLSGTANTRGDAGVAVGAGMQW